MGDYSVSNFSFNKGKAEYNGQTKRTFDLTKFDGVSKEELLRNAGGENTAKGKLITSIFSKYDSSGDGILTQEEFSAMRNDLVRMAGDGNLGGHELKRFNENMGVDKNAYSMEDLQSLVGMMVDGTDSITGVNTNGNNVTVTYNSEMTNGVTEQVFEKGVLLSQTQKAKNPPVIKGGSIDFTNSTETITYGDDGRTPVKTVIRGAGDNPPVFTKNFDTDGTTLKSAELKYTSKSGNITVEYGNDLTKPNKMTTVHPNQTKEIITYIYNDDGSIIETYTNENGQTTKVVEKDSSGNETKRLEYTYTNGKVTLEVFVDDDQQYEVSDADSVEDANNQLEQLETQVEQDQGADEPQTTEYRVAQGEVWYNLVAAKYGVNDPKTIMDIVHQLKRANEVDVKNKTMPKTLNLPNEVTVGERTFPLNTQATADPSLVRTEAPAITSPNADQVGAEDQAVDVDKNPPTNTTDPNFLTNMPTSQLSSQDLLLNEKTDNFGREILEKNDDNTFTTTEYRNQFLGTDQYQSRSCRYDARGKLLRYTVFEYDNKGNYIRQLLYDANGNLLRYANSTEDFYRDLSGKKIN